MESPLFSGARSGWPRGVCYSEGQDHSRDRAARLPGPLPTEILQAPSKRLDSGSLCQSAWATVMKHHRLGVFKNRNVFLTVLQSGRLGPGCQHSWVQALTALIWAWKGPSSHWVSIWPFPGASTERETERCPVSLSLRLKPPAYQIRTPPFDFI